LESPLSKEADTWHNYLDLEQTKLGAVEVLSIFKPEHFSMFLKALSYIVGGSQYKLLHNGQKLFRYGAPGTRLYQSKISWIHYFGTYVPCR
jgi:hypothetical protein